MSTERNLQESTAGIPRTQGDGMEIQKPISFNSVPTKYKRSVRIRPGDKVIYRAAEHCHTHLQPIVPIGPITYLIPKLQPRQKKKLPHFSYAKDPIFIPYEPFKGAVTPMLPHKKIKKVKISKNNVDIQVLVSQMSNMASVEFKNSRHDLSRMPVKKVEIIESAEISEERQRFDAEIRTLKDTNEQLEKQLKFQAQVNSELKTLLVAAIGEDLEARVQLLTEDKLQLARALLNSAQHLSTHREQVEWLAGHCEVWRSKFLASSLMVDELARWKAVLSAHVAELQETIKLLLEEHNHINVEAQCTWDTLSSVANFCDVEVLQPKALHIAALTDACKELSESIAQRLLGLNFKKLEYDVKAVETNTPAEVMAQQALTRTTTADRGNSMYNVLLAKPAVPCVHCAGRNNIN